MKKIVTILFFCSIFSCKKENTVATITENIKNNTVSGETKNLDLIKKDSLFTGEPLISNYEFIKNVGEGGTDFYYVKEYENILIKYNKIFSKYKSNEIIKTLKYSETLTLELKRSKFEPLFKNKDLQIMLFTKINNIIKDSILFYKFKVDKNDSDSRREHLTYIDDKFNLWGLESYSGQSEFFVQPESWNKYKINEITGKLNLVNKLNYMEDFSKKNEENLIEKKINKSQKWIIDSAHNKISLDISADYKSASLPLVSPAIYIFANIIKGENDKIYYLKFSEQDMESQSASENIIDVKSIDLQKNIAKLIIDDNNKLKFIWLGLYNIKTKQYEHLKNPFTKKIETEFVILNKIE